MGPKRRLAAGGDLRAAPRGGPCDLQGQDNSQKHDLQTINPPGPVNSLLGFLPSLPDLIFSL